MLPQDRHRYCIRDCRYNLRIGPGINGIPSIYPYRRAATDAASWTRMKGLALKVPLDQIIFVRRRSPDWQGLACDYEAGMPIDPCRYKRISMIAPFDIQTRSSCAGHQILREVWALRNGGCGHHFHHPSRRTAHGNCSDDPSNTLSSHGRND